MQGKPLVLRREGFSGLAAGSRDLLGVSQRGAAPAQFCPALSPDAVLG